MIADGQIARLGEDLALTRVRCNPVLSEGTTVVSKPFAGPRPASDPMRYPSCPVSDTGPSTALAPGS
jgi:hypothetical protein